MKWIHEKEIPILYGAVDKTKLKGEIYRNTNPVDMGFRLYLDSLDQWFQSPSDEVFAEPTNSLPAFSQAIIVLDGSRKDIRTTIEKASRQTCKKDKPGQGAPGVGVHVFDDIFFADSKNSIGMQIADICMYFVARHLMQKPDSEGFYNIISDQIFRPQVFP